MTKQQKYASLITGAINAIIEAEDGLDQKNANDFFTAIILSFGLIYKDQTGDKNKDLIDIMALANRLVFQYLKGGKTV